jgi:hypothetical protein
MEDLSSFLGPLSPELKRGMLLLQKLDPKDLRTVAPKVVLYMRGEEVKEADLAQLGLADAGMLLILLDVCYRQQLMVTSPASAPVLFTALYLILRGAVKSKQKIEVPRTLCPPLNIF